MISFLDKLAEYILTKYLDKTGLIQIILPNRRSRLYLNKYISARINKPIWAPQIFSIEEYIEKISGLTILDNLPLFLEFFLIHKSIQKEETGTFDEFIRWGQTLLNDFNDIDLYLIEPDKIYQYLSEAKALKVWNLESKPLTDYEKNYIKFFNLFEKYYESLKQSLLEKNQAYQGLAYRVASEKTDEIIADKQIDKIIFAGFNALNAVEEKIIDTLILNNKAELYWDADAYYVDQKEQEAGKFIRKYFNKWQVSSQNQKEDQFKNSQKKITLIAVPKQIGQVKAAGQILSNEINSENEFEDTAVVLADETLLTPMLNSIPENISHLNITMGMPLKNFSFFTLADSLFVLHDNAKRLSHVRNKDGYIFYHKDILKLFNHPYFIQLLKKYSGDIPDISDIIRSSNKSFYQQNELKKLFAGNDKIFLTLIEKLFSDWHQNIDSSMDCLLYLTDILLQFFNEQTKKTKNSFLQNPLEQECLPEFIKIIHQIRSLPLEQIQLNEIKTLRSIFNQLVSSVSLPFRGEPLKGLQIMGMLETRNLDFKNIILLSANEDILPSDKNRNSFIPYDIRKEFNLPTYKDRDSIYAYHFYHLLQRASNVFLIYNTQNDEVGGGEKSRFITQMIHELPKYNKDISITQKIFNIPVIKSENINNIIIEKDKDILEKLGKRAERGFSASTLNVYINCPLQFYFQTVAGIKEIEEAEETMAANTMGSVVHEILQQLYTPYIGKNITQIDIKKMLASTEKATIDAIKNNYADGELQYGKNFLIIKVIKKFINNFLQKEIEYIQSLDKKGIPLIIKNLEQRITTSFPFSTFERPTITLSGIIDRIDQAGETTRIIDYKTGKTDKKELLITDWQELITNPTYSKSFQLLLYMYMFIKNQSVSAFPLEAGIFSFRNLSQGLMKIVLPEDVTENYILNNFEPILKQLFDDIFNPNIAFSQTENKDNCIYCPFVSVCNR